MEPTVERYCTVEESIKESLRQIKLMQEGKMPKKSWEDFVHETGYKSAGPLCSTRKVLNQGKE